MIKRYFLLLFSCICLCINAWGIDWVGEAISTTKSYALYGVDKNKFVAYNDNMVDAGHNDVSFWSFSSMSKGTVSTTISSTYYGLYGTKESKYKNQSWEIVESTSGSNKRYQFYYVPTVGRNYLHFNDDVYMQWAAVSISDNNSYVFLISQNQYVNHVAMVAYETANTAYNSYDDESDFPTAYWALRPSSDHVDIERYLAYGDWMLSSDESATISAHTAALNAWLENADAVRSAYESAMNKVAVIVAAGYDGDDSAIQSATSASEVNAGFLAYQSAAISALSAANGIQDISFVIANPDFEATTWYYGWNGTAASDDASSDTKKSTFCKQTGNSASGGNGFETGTIFAEMWVTTNTNFASAGNLNQTITLPAGRYKLSADIVSRNVKSKLYAQVGETMNEYMYYGSDITNEYILFSLGSTSEVTIGYKFESTTPVNKNRSNDAWVAVDNFKLECIAEFPLGDITGYTLMNPNIYQSNNSNLYLPSGWNGTHVSENGTFTKTSAGDTYFENWNGTPSSFDVDYYQEITLPAGSYQASADLFFNSSTEAVIALNARYDDTDHYTDASTVTGDASAEAGPSTTYYLNFTLTETKQVKLGVKKVATNTTGTWMGADNFRLARVSGAKSLLANEDDSKYYGMFYSTDKVQLSDGAKAYTASWSESDGEWSLNLSELTGGIVPASTPVLVQASVSNIAYSTTNESADDFSSNAFEIHNYNDDSDGHKDYVLASKSGVVAFHRYDADDERGAINGKIVLVWHNPDGNASAPAFFRIVTDNYNTTALVPVYDTNDMSKLNNNYQIYTILGVPVSDMSRPGIYIQNGKKYVVH